MGYSKTFLLLGLAFAVVLLISSEVSARELAEATQTTQEVNNVGEDHFHGHGHEHGHGHGKGHGHSKGHDHEHKHKGKPGHGAAGENLEVGTENGEN